MTQRKWIADKEPWHLEICNDPKAGYYLYVWKNGKGIRDDLQDNLEQAMAVAQEDYGVLRSTWKEVS